MTKNITNEPTAATPAPAINPAAEEMLLALLESARDAIGVASSAFVAADGDAENADAVDARAAAARRLDHARAVARALVALGEVKEAIPALARGRDPWAAAPEEVSP